MKLRRDGQVVHEVRIPSALTGRVCQTLELDARDVRDLCMMPAAQLKDYVGWLLTRFDAPAPRPTP